MIETAPDAGTSPGPLFDWDLTALKEAKLILERPSLTARLANRLGAPLERGLAMLPKDWSETVHKATRSALLQALEVAVASLENTRSNARSQLLNKVMAGASGGLGGAFGLPALLFELPISTTLMLRSIADAARIEGHDVRESAVKLSCLEVFALGGRNPSDDAAESAYWAVRMAMSKAVAEAAAYLAHRRVLDKSAPAILRFIAAISARFGIMVSEQAAAKAVPIIGAAGGAVINVLFMDHFQDMARGHFIVRRLENRYGLERVRSAYQAIEIGG
jgi:hypothetical protein